MSICLSHIISISSFILNSQNDSLKLAPIKEPAPIPFTFETIGWQILAIIIFILLLFFTYKWIRHYKKNTYRRIAIKQLTAFNNINEFAILLKSVAITAYGRKKVAALYGHEWLQFLESKGKSTLFTKYTESFLEAQNSNHNIDANTKKEILSLTKKWIQTHA